MFSRSQVECAASNMNVWTARINEAFKQRDKSRLQMVLLRALEGRYKTEFQFYARLIPYICTPQFDNELRVVAERAHCRNHARLVLNSLDNHC